MKHIVRYFGRNMAVTVMVIAFLSSCNLEKFLEIDEQTATLSIGNFHEGGVIFYLDDTGQHGLVCATEDQSDEAIWGCFEQKTPGADGVAIGTGLQNSLDIVADANCDASSFRDDWASDLCLSLTLNGYEDWFLPSRDELNQMYVNKNVIDATAIANAGAAFVAFEDEFLYWNSTEINGIVSNGGCQNFNDGKSIGCGKNGINLVRAVRAF